MLVAADCNNSFLLSAFWPVQPCVHKSFRTWLEFPTLLKAGNPNEKRSCDKQENVVTFKYRYSRDIEKFVAQRISLIYRYGQEKTPKKQNNQEDDFHLQQ
uniref:Uncharacterized protein n=1 Tax=Romanomermis culicivorax TaxID=13658 RepID=A0A915HL16_ROMCU